MFLNKCTVFKILEKSVKNVDKTQIVQIHNRSLIGNRDWVAFGRSGTATYLDDPSYPYPAIRFKENSNELLALKEKEKGDWRKLCIEEKRILYRASFRQTFSEVLAPTGEWKSILGSTLFFVSLGLIVFIVEKLFVYQPLPHTFEENYRKSMYRRLLDNKFGHISGLASKWDYEKDEPK